MSDESQTPDEAPELSDVEEQLVHTLFFHVIEQAFMGLLIAREEALSIEDERGQQLTDALDELLLSINDLVNKQLDQIPGIISLEEAEELVTEALQQLALLKSMPPESLNGKEILH